MTTRSWLALVAAVGCFAYLLPTPPSAASVNAQEARILEIARLRGLVLASSAADGAPTRIIVGESEETPLPALPAVSELPVWMPNSVRRWEAQITEAANEYGLPPALLAIVVLIESNGQPRAISSAGALGLTQVMPNIHLQLTAKGADPFDPSHNLRVGAGIFSANLGTCLTIEGAAAAYNGGQCTPRYAETREYVRRLTGLWAERDAGSSVTLASMGG